MTALFLNGPIVLKNVSVEIDGDVDSKILGRYFLCQRQCLSMMKKETPVRLRLLL